MTNKSEEFLAKAKEADEFTARAIDGYMRENWHNIAESYRDLAKLNPADQASLSASF